MDARLKDMIFDFLRATSRPEEDAIKLLCKTLTKEEVTQAMIDFGYYRCDNCDYWVEQGEMVDEGTLCEACGEAEED